MSDTPHLQPSGPGDDEPDLSEILRALTGGDLSANPELADALKQMGVDNLDPAMLQMVQAQVQAMMSGPSDGSFNVALATDAARKTVSAAGDSTVGSSTARDVEQVVQVANLWLDEVTDLQAPAAGARAWSRAEWVEQTMPVWRTLVEPVAVGVGTAIREAMKQQLGQLGDADLSAELGLPPGVDASALVGQMEPMVARMSSAMFGMQVGQAVGALAGELVTGTEVGLPLVEGNPVVVLPANVAAFAEGLGIEAGEVHLYLAVREAARARLFDEVAWLAPALLAAVQSYAGDISIDTERIEEALREADTSDPAAMQSALQGSLFTPEPSEAQQRAVQRIETTLALVEGWVDVVTERATSPHLPHAAALSEAVRRRRAAGGPAERVFSSLVGLELRPRRLRDAANLWSALEEAAGAQERDRAWEHPDFAPSGEDLDDPLAYVARRTAIDADEPARDEMDDALDQLLAQGRAEMDADGAASADDDNEDGGSGAGERKPE
ncbi:zinc-dependent metalloprotease [Luteipulveratus sp. YIM 133132]|uniref:Zinc-dependent metalloprotease n=1 Tax=Luteipulveratus flavus TaxID=3031728 RepID=A0ABT6C7Z2_9MICO|nr:MULTISPECIES: zinc-dependent metalloprotease [unclassified Luteipulveratus]MDE9365857.1 zinc-dependent metalloprotease [Luteipulveratus sp. YIM 133132]MDF8265049.1 zinc-dependent metalloprotease [Luteipulveratus sp. YIM 133296]